MVEPGRLDLVTFGGTARTRDEYSGRVEAAALGANRGPRRPRAERTGRQLGALAAHADRLAGRAEDPAVRQTGRLTG